MNKIAIKQIVAFLLNSIGIFSYLFLLKKQKKTFILSYHRVLNSPQLKEIFVQPGMFVLKRSFLKQLDILKRNFQIVSLREFVEIKRKGFSLGRCCAVTFDDGWHDNYTNVFPIIKEYQIPITIFLATNFIGSNRLFWPEELTFYLQQPEIKSLIKLIPSLNRFSLQNGINTDYQLDNAIQTIKKFSLKEREELFARFRSISPMPKINRILLNWEEAKEMQSSGFVCFGAHTANHVILDQVSLHEAENEIILSKSDIENYLGSRSDLFAYPNGNYNAHLKDIIKRNDFSAAFTSRKGWVNNNTDLFEIPRIGIHEDISSTVPLFLSRIILKRF